MVVSNSVVDFILADLIDARLRVLGSAFTSAPSPEDVSSIVESLVRWAEVFGFLSDGKLDLTGVMIK